MIVLEIRFFIYFNIDELDSKFFGRSYLMVIEFFNLGFINFFRSFNLSLRNMYFCFLVVIFFNFFRSFEE